MQRALEVQWNNLSVSRTTLGLPAHPPLWSCIQTDKTEHSDLLLLFPGIGLSKVKESESISRSVVSDSL